MFSITDSRRSATKGIRAFGLVLGLAVIVPASARAAATIQTHPATHTVTPQAVTTPPPAPSPAPAPSTPETPAPETSSTTQADTAASGDSGGSSNDRGLDTHSDTSGPPTTVGREGREWSLIEADEAVLNGLRLGHHGISDSAELAAEILRVTLDLEERLKSQPIHEPDHKGERAGQQSGTTTGSETGGGSDPACDGTFPRVNEGEGQHAC
jgi:hypothetical protein